MRPLGSALPGAAAFKAAQRFAAEGLIDTVRDMARQQLCIFTGAANKIVLKVVVQNLNFYRSAGVPEQQIRFIDTSPPAMRWLLRTGSTSRALMPRPI